MKNEEKFLIMKEIQNRIRQQEIKEKAFLEKYGYIRKIVHCNTEDYKLVGVGKTLLPDKQWKTFPDFLMDYLKNVLGKEWWESSICKTKSELHPIIYWHQKMNEFQCAQKKNENGLFETRPNSAMLAYILLAYDLYTIAHNFELQETVIRRLKNIQGFQGALYELFVTSVFIRAGFKIDYSDETDRSKKPPEFIAEIPETGQLFAVEAKSRQRNGLLGRQGPSKKNIKLDITGKINDALKKDINHPFIIFIDLNLPKHKKNQKINFERLIFEYKKSYEKTQIQDKFNLIFFTDHHPCSKSDFSIALDFNDPLIVVSKSPSFELKENDLVLSKIRKSISQFGNIPNDFSEMDSDNIIDIRKDE
jgi:hypothetical protein